MAAIQQPDTTSTVAQVYAWWQKREAGGHRPHLGASVIGHACSRYLWLLFRWAGREQFDGRMLRLFEAGRQFEPRMVAELRGIGVEVSETDEFGGQHRVSDIGGHFGGSMDGAALGLPEAPKTWHVLEFKTHSRKSFDELVKKRVREAKPQHWAQMQVYMGLTGMDRAMYLAENKDTSEIYAERVEFDLAEFTRLRERARSIIEDSTPPARLSEDPAWYECKWCPFHGHCHGQTAPEVNCRTCAHSTPVLAGEGGEWRCELQGVPLDPFTQAEGCNGHRFIPILLERIGRQSDATDEPDGNLAVTYTLPNGETFINGYSPALASREIAAGAQVPQILADPRLAQIKDKFPGATLARADAEATA